MPGRRASERSVASWLGADANIMRTSGRDSSRRTRAAAISDAAASPSDAGSGSRRSRGRSACAWACSWLSGMFLQLDDTGQTHDMTIGSWVSRRGSVPRLTVRTGRGGWGDPSRPVRPRDRGGGRAGIMTGGPSGGERLGDDDSLCSPTTPPTLADGAPEVSAASLHLGAMPAVTPIFQVALMRGRPVLRVSRLAGHSGHSSPPPTHPLVPPHPPRGGG